MAKSKGRNGVPPAVCTQTILDEPVLSHQVVQGRMHPLGWSLSALLETLQAPKPQWHPLGHSGLCCQHPRGQLQCKK